MLRGVRELALRPSGNLIRKVPNPARKGNMRNRPMDANLPLTGGFFI